MPEKYYAADWYGKVYVQILESKLSAHAKLCYAVMSSYGEETRASIKSYCLRMSASSNTVRKAQKELQDAGWIELKSEGKDGLPREWYRLHPANPNGQIQGTKWRHPLSGEEGYRGEGRVQDVRGGVQDVKGVGSGREGGGGFRT